MSSNQSGVSSADSVSNSSVSRSSSSRTSGAAPGGFSTPSCANLEYICAEPSSSGDTGTRVGDARTRPARARPLGESCASASCPRFGGRTETSIVPGDEQRCCRVGIPSPGQLDGRSGSVPLWGLRGVYPDNGAIRRGGWPLLEYSPLSAGGLLLGRPDDSCCASII